MKNIKEGEYSLKRQLHNSMRGPLMPDGVTCNILGVNIAVTNIRSLIRQFVTHLNENRGNYICVSNVHTTVMAHDNPEYRKIQNGGLMAIPDGKPLVFVSHLKGYKQAQRCAGPDLMPALLAYSVQNTNHFGECHKYRHFFYGSTQETIDLLEKKLRKEFPGLEIAGMISPPFRELTPEEDAEMIRKINEAKPDFVWVGLGAPKQEKWMYDHKGKINALMIGVGAAFDFGAGTAKRAPRWMQEAYLEWLYRLMQNPKRLFHRYFTTNVRFVFLNMFHR